MTDFNKHEVARHFARAANSYQRYNSLQQQVAKELLKRMPAVDKLLDLGCGPAINTAVLAQRCQYYVGIDLSAGMLAQARQQEPTHAFVLGDAEQLPLADNSLDGIFSNLAVQWCNSPDLLFSELARVLRPGSVAVLSTVLQGSLQPLTSLRRRLEKHPDVHEVADSHPELALWTGALASNDGLIAEELSQSRFTFYADEVKQLLLSIKGVGAGYQPYAKTRLQRQTLCKLTEVYELHRTAQGLPLHYEIGFMVLRALPLDEKKS